MSKDKRRESTALAFSRGSLPSALFADNRAMPEVTLFVNIVLVTYRFAPVALNMQRDVDAATVTAVDAVVSRA